MSKVVNLGIIHDYSEYKGKEIYEILKHNFQNKVIQGKKINFLILGSCTKFHIIKKMNFLI